MKNVFLTCQYAATCSENLILMFLSFCRFFFQIEEILGEHATLFKEHYYIKPTGNCDLSSMSDPHNEFRGKNVLIERSNTEALAKKQGMSMNQYLEILGQCRETIFDVRSKRPRPHLDDKVLYSTY